MSTVSAIMDWLNANAGVVGLFFSMVVAASTVVYATLTSRLVTETRWMRRAQTDPRVMVRIEPSEIWINLINLHVENIGGGPATDVRFEVLIDLRLDHRRSVSALGLVKYGVGRLVPGQRITTHLFSIPDRISESEGIHDLIFKLRVRYFDQAGMAHREDIEIGFAHLEGIVTVGEPPLLTIASQLEKIQKDLASVCNGSRRLQVATFSKEDRQEEALKRRTRMEELRRELDAKQAEAKVEAGTVQPDRESAE